MTFIFYALFLWHLMKRKDLALKYRGIYGYDMPTLALAKIMHSKEPAFRTVEDARTSLRYIEGKGSSNTPQYIKRMPDRPYNPYALPKSYEEKREPFILPLGCNNILLISDLHIPYHNIEAISLAMDYGIEKKVNTIFINGDLIDCATVSKFEPDLKKRSLKEEFDLTKDFLRQLRFYFPDAEIYWLKGNHCIRWEKFLMSKVHQIWDDPYFHLEERLRLNEERIKILDDATLVKAGKLAITHGHHIFKGIFSPVSPARGAYMKAKQSVIVGHLHRPSYHPETDMEGNIVAAWSLGCLCELKPKYSPLISNSQHGFAHVVIEESGDFTVYNKTIINGKVH
jgi:predicted phosphodiesterase